MTTNEQLVKKLLHFHHDHSAKKLLAGGALNHEAIDKFTQGLPHIATSYDDVADYILTTALELSLGSGHDVSATLLDIVENGDEDSQEELHLLTKC